VHDCGCLVYGDCESRSTHRDGIRPLDRSKTMVSDPNGEELAHSMMVVALDGNRNALLATALATRGQELLAVAIAVVSL
jgi:hypothetical protein